MTSALHQTASHTANARQIQQRQILSLMGVECWVSRDSKTVHFADTDIIKLNQSDKPQSDERYNEKEGNNPSTQYDNDIDKNINSAEVTQALTTNNTINNSTYSDTIKSSQAVKQVLSKLKHETTSDTKTEKAKLDTAATVPIPIVEQLIEPFTLLAVGFGDWVLLVDSQHLHEGSTLPLWRNIILSMSLTEQSLSFPICEGMQSVELANASLAGFVFCIAQDDNKRVAAMTPLPDGLDHERLVSVPLLSEMLADGRQKRQLWQLLMSSSVSRNQS